MSWIKLDIDWYADVRFEQLGESFGASAFGIPIVLASTAGPSGSAKITPWRFSRIAWTHPRDFMPIVSGAIDLGLFRTLRYYSPDLLHVRATFCRYEQERVPVTKTQRERIIERDRGTCGICGRVVGPEDILEIDHIHPVSKGGLNDDVNLQVSHFRCNRAKAARI